MGVKETRMASSRVIERRNIIVVGKTGTGKSTVANHILGIDKFKVSDSLDSTTDKVSHGEREEDGIEEGKKYIIKVVDTVGLFDTTALKNKKAMKEIKKYINEQVPDGIHLVLFLFKKGKFTNEEKGTFDFVLERFGDDIKNISALLITHCENDDANSREQLKHDFRTNLATKGIANFMGKGIHTVGFPDLSRCNPRLKPIHQEGIRDDEAEMKQLIYRSGDCDQVLTRQLLQEAWWERCHLF